MDKKDKYLSKKEKIINNFQKHAILQFISDYISKQFNKIPCQTLVLSEK